MHNFFINCSINLSKKWVSFIGIIAKGLFLPDKSWNPFQRRWTWPARTCRSDWLTFCLKLYFRLNFSNIGLILKTELHSTQFLSCPLSLIIKSTCIVHNTWQLQCLVTNKLEWKMTQHITNCVSISISLLAQVHGDMDEFRWKLERRKTILAITRIYMLADAIFPTVTYSN